MEVRLLSLAFASIESKGVWILDRLLGIDAVATMIGVVLGTSTNTSYIESAADIEQGRRSGLTSIITGVLFLLALLFVPIVGIVPEYATAPALWIHKFHAYKISLRQSEPD